MKNFKRILLTNDDGYDSEYLLLMKTLLEKYAESVEIIAPLSVQSAKSSSITIGQDFEIRKISEDIFALNGTPCDCVSYGLHIAKDRYDLVVSGCNKGENIGHDTIYSGTCGAALEATFYGYKAIAFSAPRKNKEIIIKEFDKTMSFILENDMLSKNYTLNVNFPNSDHSNGIRITRLSKRVDQIAYALENAGKRGHRMFLPETNDVSDTDWYCYQNSLTSITPLKASFFDEEAFNKFSK